MSELFEVLIRKEDLEMEQMWLAKASAINCISVIIVSNFSLDNGFIMAIPFKFGHIFQKRFVVSSNYHQ
jgi:hypothetical protein